MNDLDLFVAQNERPALTPGAAWQPALFPDTGTVKFLDLRTAIDLARGTPVYANFRVATAFEAVAANFLRFAAFVDATETFDQVVAVTPALTIARSHDFSSANLALGATCSIALPPFSDITRAIGEGMRYLALGVEALAPAVDWASGGVDAWFSRHPIASRPLSHVSGY